MHYHSHSNLLYWVKSEKRATFMHEIGLLQSWRRYDNGGDSKHVRTFVDGWGSFGSGCHGSVDSVTGKC